MIKAAICHEGLHALWTLDTDKKLLLRNALDIQYRLCWFAWHDTKQRHKQESPYDVKCEKSIYDAWCKVGQLFQIDNSKQFDFYRN